MTLKLSDKIRVVVNQINTSALISNGQVMYLDGNIAYSLIKEFADEIITDAVRDVAGSDAIKDPEPNPTRKPGRPKGE